METRLNIAGVTLSVAHRYDLTDAWCCAGHETAAEPQFAVSATEEELGQEFDRLKGRFDLAACEGNCLYRRAALGMLDYDGFLLHATAVAVDGAGYVFTAPGGTGKSTHAGLWMQVFGSRALMVNGDKPILRRRMEGGFAVCGTPWRGKERLGCAAIVPLRGVCLLERGAENAIEPADLDTVLDRIFRQVLPPETAEQAVRQLGLLDRLVREVPVYRLRCNMDPEAALVAYRGMNAGR